jgi:mannose-6-phosphate isomerase-like protein (cupin superfamily)
VVGPGEGESLELGASRASVKAGTDALTVVDIAMAPDFPHPPPHRHRSTVEGLYVLEGEPGLRVGDDEVTLAPGGCAFVPPGTVHASPPGGAPVRILNLFAPGALVGLMREAAAGGAPDLGAYDIEFV